MKIVRIAETLTINVDMLESVLYPVYNARISRSNHAYDTIMKKIAYARRYNHFQDYTNDRDKIKSLIVLSNGTVFATSLTRDGIEEILTKRRNNSSK